MSYCKTNRAFSVDGATLAFAVWCLGVLYFFSEFFFSKFDLISGNLGDNRFSICIHEHWFQVFTGRNSWLNPLFFFPEKHVLGYSDAFFLNSFVYTAIRALGGDEFISFQVTLIVISLLGYLSFYYLCRYLLGMTLPFSLLASVVFSFSSLLFVSKGWAQMLTIYYAPLLLVMMFFCRRSLVDDSLDRYLWGASGAVLGAACFFTAYNISWFLLFFLMLSGCCYLAIERFRIKKLLFVKSSFMVFVMVIFFLALIPFLITYLPVYFEGFRRGYESATPHLLSASDYFNFSGIVWKKITAPLKLPISRLADRSPSMGLFLLFILIGINRIRNAVKPLAANRDKVFAAVFIAAVISWLLMLKVGDFSLWRYVVLFIPGAGGNRVVFRFQAVIGMFCTIVVFYYLDLSWRHFSFSSGHRFGDWGRRLGRSALFAVALLLMVEQYTNQQSDAFSRAAEASRLKIPAPSKNYDAFFVFDPENTKDKIPSSSFNYRFIARQIDAMLIAQRTGIPTINGYSGWLPKKWIFMYPEKNPVYLNQISAWLYGQADPVNVAALDMGNKKWIDKPFDAIMNLSEIQFKISAGTPHRVGHFLLLRDGTGVISVKKGKPGVLFFGPYIPLHKGKYKATYKIESSHLEGENKSLAFGSIDVNRVAKRRIAQKNLYQEKTRGRQDYVLTFEVPGSIDARDVYEFRVVSNGTSDMTLMGIFLSRLP